jgi:hypothetical protein
MFNHPIPRLAALTGLVFPAFLGLCAGKASAFLVFSFQEVGGSVQMKASGTLNTTQLISVPATTTTWGGIGIEPNNPPNSEYHGRCHHGEYI